MKHSDSKASKIRELTLEILSDGKVHLTKEIMDHALKQRIIQDKNTDIVYNVLFHMKKDGIIDPGPDKAQYCLSNIGIRQKCKRNTLAEVSETKKQTRKVSTVTLDKEQYSLLLPMSTKYSRMTLTVKEDGTLRMNSVLLRNMKVRDVEIYVSKDYKSIVLNSSGTCVHNFTKAGTAKNKELALMLRKMKVSFPVLYVVEWNESMGAWEGVLNLE